MFFKKITQTLFDAFSSNKLKSHNSAVRKKAVQALPVSDQDSLSKIAMNDADESIRAIAVNKLNDLDLLQTILLKCSSEPLKKTTQTRLFQLLCGMKHPIPDYNIREKIIHGSRHSALLEFVAANAEQAALREMALTKVTREPLLGDIALSDDSSKVRQLAAQQIGKRSTLERVASASRRKDKRVYKIVKSKLDIIIEDEERPILLSREVLEICDKLEKLYKRNRLKQEKSTFENYVKRWAEISNFSSPENSQRFSDIKSKINDSFIELEDKSNKENELISGLEKLLNQLSIAVDEVLIEQENNQQQALSITHNEAVGEKEKNILKLGREWDNKIQLLKDKKLVDSYNNQFYAILELAESNTDSHSNNDNVHIEKIKTLLSQAESIAQSSGFILQQTVSTLQKKFNQQIKHSTLSLDELDEYKQKFSSIFQLIDKKIIRQYDKAKQLKQQINTDIEQIKVQIKQGFTSKATKLLQSLNKLIDKSHDLSPDEKNSFHTDLRAFQSELGELSSWKSWAHDHERENLIVKAEQLFSQYKDSGKLASEYKDITAQIKQLRLQWKNMRSPTAEDLWQKFNHSCNVSYELCTPFIEQLDKDRINNLQQKESLCEQLENYIKVMGWSAGDTKTPEADSNTDWIQIDKISRQARKEWSAIGFVDRKVHKKISQKFEDSMQIIRTELHKGWEINQKIFEDLIVDVEALHAQLEDNLGDAINQAKKYQQQWKKVGPVSPHQRNKLWKKFRAACDVIFDKRQQGIDDKNSKNDELIREKEAICENLEALNLQPLKRKDLEQAFADVKNIWTDLYTQSKSAGKALNQRFSQAEKEYFIKIDQLLAEEQLQVLEKIKQKAQICTQVEQQSNMSEDEYTEFYEQVNQQWQSIKGLSHSIETGLFTRFKQALDILQSEPSAETIAGLKEKELEFKQEFCLKYEILTGKDSPAADEQARMQKQVDLLNHNMGQKQFISTFEMHKEWYNFSNYTQHQALENRFKQLIS